MASTTTVLHWMATYFFCCSAIAVTIVSDLLVTPFLLSLQSFISEVPPENIALDMNSTANSTAARLLATSVITDGAQPLVHITEEPFVSSHPFLFSLISHSAMMCGLPLYYSLGYIRRVLRFPRLRTMRKRLKSGSSKFGNMLAVINEQFDDCMIEGRVNSISEPAAFLVMGLLSTTWLLYLYLWRESFFYASDPLATSLSYFYILFVSPLMIPILKKRLHGLNLIGSVICFLGIYIYFFPEVAAASSHSLYDTSRAIMLGIAGAFIFSLYLLYYRLLNPDGWMLKVVGYQGLGVLLFGTIIMALFHFTGLELLVLPTRASDIQLIIYHSIARLCIFICINEALRWGDPPSIATAFTVVPPMSYILKRSISLDSSPLSSSKVISLALTLGGFAVVALYHFHRAFSHDRRSMYHSSGSLSERKRLIVGSDYII